MIGNWPGKRSSISSEPPIAAEPRKIKPAYQEGPFVVHPGSKFCGNRKIGAEIPPCDLFHSYING
jgi:hypothetical protein